MDKFDEFDKVNENNKDLILEDIKEFLQLYLFKGVFYLNNDTIENLFDLSHEDLIKMKTVHFILTDEVNDLINSLSQLIRNLSHSTKKEYEIYNGTIRGRIDWNQTFKERLSRGHDDKSLFVCALPSKYYDLEENQLLKYVLKRIIYLKENYLSFISAKSDDLKDIDENDDWYTIVNNHYIKCKKMLKKVYFDDISSISKVKSKHIRKCYKNRNGLYHKVAEVYKIYEELFINSNADLLKELIEKRVIKSIHPDKLYEIYIFFNLVRALPEVTKYKLLMSNNDYSICSENDDLKITIYYQKTPKELKEVSQYLDILKTFNISGKTRNPDIIIEFKNNNEIKYRLIEIKNSSSGEYINSSVYKVMGYYKDFEKINHLDKFSFVENYPVVMINWAGSSINEEIDSIESEILILNRKEFIKNVNNLITI